METKIKNTFTLLQRINSRNDSRARWSMKNRFTTILNCKL